MCMKYHRIIVVDCCCLFITRLYIPYLFIYLFLYFNYYLFTHAAAKSQFLATMSHEIRTPMVGVNIASRSCSIDTHWFTVTVTQFLSLSHAHTHTHAYTYRHTHITHTCSVVFIHYLLLTLLIEWFAGDDRTAFIHVATHSFAGSYSPLAFRLYMIWVAGIFIDATSLIRLLCLHFICS